MTTNRLTQPGTDAGRRPRLLTPGRRLMPLFAALALHACVLTAAAEDRLTQLAPESLTVQLQNGAGTADVTFALAKGADLPTFKVTDAVGAANTIHAVQNQISFEWIAPPKTPDASRPLVLTGRLTVKTDVYVEPDTNYVGRIIFTWPDGAPQPVSFNISDKATLAFSLVPANFNLTLAQSQPDYVVLRVKNTGQTAIKKVRVSSSDLTDAETRRRIEHSEQDVDLGAAGLAPQRDAELTFKIPHAAWAGSYTGTINVTANGGSNHQSIPLVLQSRGPAPSPDMFWVPYVLFFATLALGCLLSYALEHWFSLGGLQRAEALLSLQKSGRELARIAAWVEELTTGRPATVFAQTRIRLQHEQDGLTALLRRLPELTRDELTAESRRFAASAALAATFESAVGVALKRWPDQPDKLNNVLTSLDRVAPGADPNAYRASLRAALEAAADASADTAETFDSVKALPDVPAPADLEKKIRFMALLERGVAALLVCLMAYQIFFARDFAFGTLLDYVGVFLWTLGLTQTGTQLITRARSSYTPAH